MDVHGMFVKKKSITSALVPTNFGFCRLRCSLVSPGAPGVPAAPAPRPESPTHPSENPREKLNAQWPCPNGIDHLESWRMTWIWFSGPHILVGIIFYNQHEYDLGLKVACIHPSVTIFEGNMMMNHEMEWGEGALFSNTPKWRWEQQKIESAWFFNQRTTVGALPPGNSAWNQGNCQAFFLVAPTCQLDAPETYPVESCGAWNTCLQLLKNTLPTKNYQKLFWAGYDRIWCKDNWLDNQW